MNQSVVNEIKEKNRITKKKKKDMIVGKKIIKAFSN